MGRVKRVIVQIFIIACLFFTQSSNFIDPSLISNIDKDNFFNFSNHPLFSNSNHVDQNSSSMYRWVLAWWKDNTIACNIYLNATGNPSFNDVSEYCGEDILTAWQNTPACTSSSKTGTQNCKGLYLLLMGVSKPGEEFVAPKTPKISTSAGQYNCSAWGTCLENPRMVFTIESDQESVTDHTLKIEIDEFETVCQQSSCLLDMPLTDEEGVEVKYWAETSDGSVLYEHDFQMRNQRIATDEGEQHLFELIGDEWTSSADAAANIWNIFPDLNVSRAAWNQRVKDESSLNTDVDYAMLAGRLIWYGYVDASACPDSGLLPNGSADECGVSKAYDLVLEWQNRFNNVILRASQETNIPPRIIKGLIAQESQFWPMWPSKPEFGYGMMTENGIDLLLTWNTEYYLDLCNQHYTPDDCDDGYSSLTEKQRQFLRGASLLSVGTDEEFVLLAEILKASCAQAGHLVELITQKKPGEVYDYETLWRISLGVYTVGSGCMRDAIKYSWNDYKRAMTWNEFKKHIQPECIGAKEYFDWVVYYGE